MQRVALLAFVLSLFPFVSLRAQDESVRGPSMGGDLVAMVMRTTSGSGRSETPSGVGIRAQLSYGFTERLGVFVGAQRVAVRTGRVDELTQYEAGATITFLGIDSPVRPYLEGAVVARQIVTRLAVIDGATPPLRSHGNAVQVTGGVHLFDFRRLSIDLAVAVTNGSFRDPSALDERLELLRGNVPSTALRAGVRYFPGWMGGDR